MTVAADAEAERAIGVAQLHGGRLAAAEAAARAALGASVGVDRLPALRLLAAMLGRGGRDADAARVLAEAASFDAEGGGRDPDCWNDLGVARERTGRLEEAETAYRRAIALRSDHVHAHNHLGNALRKQGRLTEAMAEHREAVRIDPGYAAAYNNLAAALSELGRAEEAIACHRMAVRALPDSNVLHSALLHDLHYSDRVSPGAMFDAHLAWARRHATGTAFQPVIAEARHGLEGRATALCHPALAPFFAAPAPPPRTPTADL